MNVSNDALRYADLPDGEALDRAIGALADHGRRTVVEEVTANGPTTVDDLAEKIAGNDDRRTPRRAKIRLIHCDLPKLADAGVVTYDPDVGTVASGDDEAEVARLLGSSRLE